MTGTSSTSAYEADFQHFSASDRGTILDALKRFVADASPSQDRAWRDSIPKLQYEVREVIGADGGAARYHAVLEYRLPMEFRRIDALFLLRGMVLVLEVKGKAVPSDADIDQAHAYARDLRCYHAECEGRPVQRFLDACAYRPLASLVRAARELFERGSLTRIRRASSATDPAVASRPRRPCS